MHRSNSHRNGSSQLGAVMCVLGVLIAVGFVFHRRMQQELQQPVSNPIQTQAHSTHQTAAPSKPQMPTNSIVPLDAARQKSHWTNPFSPNYWHATQWVFADDTLTSSAVGKSSATFLQPYHEFSISAAFAYSPLSKEDGPSADAGSILRLSLVSAASKPLLELQINNDRALLLTNSSDAAPTLLREVPIEVAFGRGYLRIVLTQDRLLTFLDEHVLWNVPRPSSLPDEAVFVQFATEERSVTLSEMRLDSAG